MTVCHRHFFLPSEFLIGLLFSAALIKHKVELNKGLLWLAALAQLVEHPNLNKVAEVRIRLGDRLPTPVVHTNPLHSTNCLLVSSISGLKRALSMSTLSITTLSLTTLSIRNSRHNRHSSTTFYHYAERRFAECHYAKCLYAKCLYAECHHAECRGALKSNKLQACYFLARSIILERSERFNGKNRINLNWQ
jgi:hypothetical protein